MAKQKQLRDYGSAKIRHAGKVMQENAAEQAKLAPAPPATTSTAAQPPTNTKLYGPPKPPETTGKLYGPPAPPKMYGPPAPEKKPTKVTENITNKPFMAMDVDERGIPIYGVGIKGWARKAVADLTDPAKYFQDLASVSQVEQDRITAEFESNKKAGGRTVEALTKWSKWGQKVTGVTAEEIGALGALGAAERDIAKTAGDSVAGTAAARMARLGIDTTQNFVWGGLAVLGMADQAARKIHSTAQGLDSVADKFSKDEDKTLLSKIYSSNPIEIGQDVFTIAKAVSDRKITWSETGEAINKYQAGSEMAYTNMFDEVARAEFEKGLAEGKDPMTMAQNLGNIGIELAGSILGDPTTYLGMSLVKPVNIWSKSAKAGQVLSNEVKLFRISARVPWKTIGAVPTFGELIGANVGHTRLAGTADRFINPAIDGLADVLGKAGKSEPAKYLDEAKKLVLNRYGSEAVNTLDKMAVSNKMKWWNLAATDAAGKVNIVSRDTSLFLQSLVADHGLDGAMEITRDMARLRSTDPAVAERAAEKLIGKQSGMIFSNVGEMIGEILARIGDEDLLSLVKKNSSDPQKLHSELMGRLHSVIQEFVPSTDEMRKASIEAAELLKKGEAIPEKTAKFAEMYKDVPAVVKAVNLATKPLNWISSTTSRAMVFTFMNMVPRSLAKNIEGAFIPMAMRIGFMEALDASLSGFIGLSKNKSTDVLFQTNSAIDQLVGFVPAYDGIAKMVGEEGKGIWKYGFLPALKRSEEIMAQKIILQTVKNEIQNALPAVVKNLPEWDAMIKMLPENQRALPFIALSRTNGDVDKAFDLMRKWVGKGEMEAWRITDPPPALKNYLDDNNLLDKFRTAQETAQDDIQFKKVIDDVMGQYTDFVKAEAAKLPWTNTKMPETLNDWGMDMTKIPEDQRNLINGVILSWRNTQDALASARNSVIKKAEEFAHLAGTQGDNVPFQKLQEIKAKLQNFDPIMSKTYQEMDAVRRVVVEETINKVTPETVAQMWTKKVRIGGKDKFSLAETYPNVDITGMTVKEFKKLAWPAMFENTSATFRNANLAVYENTLEELNNVTAIFGGSLDDVVGSAKAGDGVFAVLLDARNKAIEIEEAYAWQRFFRQQEFNKAKDLTFSQAVSEFQNTFPDWTGDVNKLVSEVNDRNTKKTNIAIIAQKYGFASISETGVPKDKMLLNIINDYARTLVEKVDTKAGKVTKERNALTYLKSKGGIDPKEFTDIFGGKFGVDKQGVVPGLFKKGSKNGIDYVATRLVEGGFMTADEITDLNNVRDFLRNYQPGEVADDVRAAALEAQSFFQRGFTRLDEVPQGLAEEAFKASPHAKPVVDATIEAMPAAQKVTAETMTLKDAIEAIRAKKVVPPYDGRLPTEARTLYEGVGAVTEDIKKWSDSVVSEWGRTVKTLPTDITEQMQAVKAAIKPRMDTVKLQAVVTGVSTRNFVLHDYNKTYLDHALSYTLQNSFHYWTTRTYMRSMESLVDNPKYANAYMNYKEYNTKRHSDQPDWYRQNLQFDSLMGIPLKNPLFVNFEQAINPMYGLTGTDFDDPRKTVDWVTRMVNDMNRMGPTFSPLVSWAVGMHAYSIGEEEAGQRWFGRMLPQSQIVKSATSAIFGNAWEIDPFVALLDKGVDPYERNRVVASLASMVRNGEITQEQMIEAARAGEGEIWDKGIEASATARFGGDATSFFLGAGIRPRTENDMKIEKFWQNYSVMVNSRSMMSAEEYREAWDNMRDNPDYGQFMDALLLSRKSGEEMDTAYAYNVFGRVPPGQLNDALEKVGISPAMVQSFYDNKGDFEKMNMQPQDKQRFMAGAVDIAAVYKMPSSANRKDWSFAKQQYNEMNLAIAAKYGDSMLVKMNEYWNAPNMDDYLEKNPDVAEAMQYKDAIVVNNPKLMEYYGSMFTLERYYVADAENQLTKKYGATVAEKVQVYESLQTTEEKATFLQQNSKLKAYQAEYGDADLKAAEQLKSKYKNIEVGLQLYKSEKALRDPEYKKKIYEDYRIKAYNKELNALTKEERKAINERYGEQLVMDARAYSIASPERKDELENKYSPLQAYMNDRKAFMDKLDSRLVTLGANLPEEPNAEMRPDQPANPNEPQQALQEMAQNRKTAADWEQELGAPALELIKDYGNGESLPPSLRTHLNRVADDLGYYDGNELIQAILITLQ